MIDGCLITERLRLDELREDDADALFRYRADPKVALYQGWRPATPDDALQFIRAQRQPPPETRGGWRQRAIRLLDQDVLIGDLGVYVPGNPLDSYEFGISIAPDHQGRRFAREAVCTLLDHLFMACGAHRVQASIDPRNKASHALMHSLGLRQEGHFRERFWLRGEWVDDMVFAMLAREWPASGPHHA